MEKRDLSLLVGNIIVHKKLGPCEVIEVVNNEEAKFAAKVVSTGEIKKFVLSPQFFENIDDFHTTTVKVAQKKEGKKIHRKVDLDKYRNHPLVKQIDQQESRSRSRLLAEAQLEDEEEDLEEVED